MTPYYEVNLLGPVFGVNQSDAIMTPVISLLTFFNPITASVIAETV